MCYNAHFDWEANVVSYDDSDRDTNWRGAESDDETVAAHNTERRRAHEENLSDIMRPTPGFKARPVAIIDEDLDKLACQGPQTKLLRWHYMLGHLSFKIIKGIA
jgi:hypothetical protein